MPYQELEEFQGNLKTITQENANKLKKEILELGWTAPVFVWDKKILDGHGRLFVLKQLDAEGYEIPEIPVIEIYAKDEHEAGRILLGINSNFQTITNEGFLDFIETYNIDFPELENIVLPNIDMKIIEQEMLGENEGLIEDDEIPEVTESKVKLGDIWQLGNHRIMCGDSIKENDVEKLMNGKKADMIFTDPPYNVDLSSKNEFLNLYDNSNRSETPISGDHIDAKEYQNFCDKIYETIEGIVADYNSIYITGNYESLIQFYKKDKLKISNMIVWIKHKLIFGRMDYQNQHEFILYGWINRHKWYGNRKQTTVWDYRRPDISKLHPTMKPVELIVNAIINSSKTNQMVVDLFLGSGATLIACEKTNRICYGMELDTNYCDVIITRWEEYTGQKAKLLMNINT